MPSDDSSAEKLLTREYLQLNRSCARADLRIIVHVDARLECSRADGILGSQAKMQSDRIAGRDRIEVEDSLRRSEAELLQATTLKAGAFLNVGLQVLAEQVESRRNSEVNHYHVRGFGQIVLDSSGGSCD